MVNLDSIDTCANSIKSVIADETLNDLILNEIISIRNSREDLIQTHSQRVYTGN